MLKSIEAKETYEQLNSPIRIATVTSGRILGRNPGKRMILIVPIY